MYWYHLVTMLYHNMIYKLKSDIIDVTMTKYNILKFYP